MSTAGRRRSRAPTCGRSWCRRRGRRRPATSTGWAACTSPAAGRRATRRRSARTRSPPRSHAFATALRASGLPYAGCSAGAAIAAGLALVGGWRFEALPVCDEDAGEDLDELEVRPGLGLVPFAVDVHATQWGTLTRLAHAVAGGLVASGVAVDEHTCVEVRGDELTLHGLGSAYRLGLGTLHVLRP